MSIHSELKEAGVKLDSHYSDLYAEKTPESKKIIDKYEFKKNVTTFINQKNNKVWYDIPFANQDWWDKRIDT